MALTYRPGPGLDQQIDALAFIDRCSKQELIDMAVQHYITERRQDRSTRSRMDDVLNALPDERRTDKGRGNA